MWAIQLTLSQRLKMHISGRYAAHKKGTPKNPHFSCFLKFYPPKGSKIQIRSRYVSTGSGIRLFGAESARVAVVEVSELMRDRGTQKETRFPSAKMAPLVGPRSNFPTTSQSGHVILKFKIHPNRFNGSGDNREKP